MQFENEWLADDPVTAPLCHNYVPDLRGGCGEDRRDAVKEPASACGSVCEHPGGFYTVRGRAAAARGESGFAAFAGRCRWIASAASFFSVLLSRIRHAREIGRIRAAWATIDDRTLMDIGVSRYEIEYGEEARHRR
jgi:uncharacterized protein YjiS (DUF1127 family)